MSRITYGDAAKLIGEHVREYLDSQPHKIPEEILNKTVIGEVKITNEVNKTALGLYDTVYGMSYDSSRDRFVIFSSPSDDILTCKATLISKDFSEAIISKEIVKRYDSDTSTRCYSVTYIPEIDKFFALGSAYIRMIDPETLDVLDYYTSYEYNSIAYDRINKTIWFTNLSTAIEMNFYSGNGIIFTETGRTIQLINTDNLYVPDNFSIGTNGCVVFNNHLCVFHNVTSSDLTEDNGSPFSYIVEYDISTFQHTQTTRINSTRINQRVRDAAVVGNAMFILSHCISANPIIQSIRSENIANFDIHEFYSCGKYAHTDISSISQLSIPGKYVLNTRMLQQVDDCPTEKTGYFATVTVNQIGTSTLQQTYENDLEIYTRTRSYGTNNFSEWISMKSMVTPVQLKANMDLNNVVQSGYYGANNYAISSTIKNTPIPYAFLLNVIRYSGGLIYQTLRVWDKPGDFRRTYGNGAWTPWISTGFIGAVNTSTIDIDTLQQPGLYASTNNSRYTNLPEQIKNTNFILNQYNTGYVNKQYRIQEISYLTRDVETDPYHLETLRRCEDHNRGFDKVPWSVANIDEVTLDRLVTDNLSITQSGSNLNVNWKDMSLISTNIEKNIGYNFTSINENDDLNDYKTLGKYVCNTTVKAKTLKNSPTSVAFNLTIEAFGPEGGTIQQVIRSYNDSGSFRRYYYAYGETWGPWTSPDSTSPNRTDIDANTVSVFGTYSTGKGSTNLPNVSNKQGVLRLLPALESSTYYSKQYWSPFNSNASWCRRYTGETKQFTDWEQCNFTESTLKEYLKSVLSLNKNGDSVELKYGDTVISSISL